MKTLANRRSLRSSSETRRHGGVGFGRRPFQRAATEPTTSTLDPPIESVSTLSHREEERSGSRSGEISRKRRARIARHHQCAECAKRRQLSEQGIRGASDIAEVNNVFGRWTASSCIPGKTCEYVST